MRKGVLFSIMILFLVGSLLSMYQISLKQNSGLQEASSTVNAFRKVSDKFSNIKNNFTTLTKNKQERLIDQRILPFNYLVDDNSFSIQTDLPLRAERIEAYLENLNAFRVFLEDTNYSKEFDSLNVDIDTLIPNSWGGSDRDISFEIQPQCLKYSILDSNKMMFEFVCADYNYMVIKKHDLNISLKSIHDFNSMVCNFNGSSTCFQDDYNAQQNTPYLNLNFNDSECPSCILTQTSVSGHFDPSQTSTINLSCSGAGCVSPQISIDFTDLTSIEFTGQAVELSYLLELDSNITSFDFADANILVENSIFNVKRQS
ncbi:MAG: hypothetical protein ABIH20_02815 [Candidatus Diapherotrites archaeon]